MKDLEEGRILLMPADLLNLYSYGKSKETVYYIARKHYKYSVSTRVTDEGLYIRRNPTPAPRNTENAKQIQTTAPNQGGGLNDNSRHISSRSQRVTVD